MRTLLLLCIGLSLTSFADVPPPPERGEVLMDVTDAGDIVVRPGTPFTLYQREPTSIRVTDATPPKSRTDKLLDFVLSEHGAEALLALVLGAFGGVAGLNELRRRRLADGIYYAFHFMEDYAATTPDTTDDKVAGGLKELDKWMLAHGWRPLKPAEIAIAKMGFTMHNGETKVQEKVAAAAADEAKDA